MSTELYRKYINIVEGRNNQLDEGLMDKIKSLIPKAMKMLGGETIADIANKVKQVTGGDYTPSEENAIKVAKAFGFDKMVSDKNNNPAVAEGLAGNWQGRLLQLVHVLGVGAGLSQALPGHSAGPWVGPAIAGVGMILLMVSQMFWSSKDGMIGAMGRDGRQGWETEK